MKEEVVFTYVVDDGRVPIQKLSLMDQFRVLIKKLFYDESSELKRIDVLTKEEMRLKTNLIQFLTKATEPIRSEGKNSVTFSLHSKFLKPLEEIQKDTASRFYKYYTFEVIKPRVEYDVEYHVKVKMTVKE